MKRSSLLVLAGISLVVVAGCTHHSSDEDTDSTSMKLETSCKTTLCDAMQASHSAEVDQCFDAADMADGDVSFCDTSSPTCSDEDRKTCDSTNWTFDVRAPADASYQAACEREMDHVTSCGITTENRAWCATYAKVERPELARFYDCSAALPCDQLTTNTTCNPPLSTLGDELCGKLAQLSRTSSCDPTWQTFLNNEGAWLRDDSIAAVKSCEKALNVDDMIACVTAWAAVVAPETTVTP